MAFGDVRLLVLLLVSTVMCQYMCLLLLMIVATTLWGSCR